MSAQERGTQHGTEPQLTRQSGADAVRTSRKAFFTNIFNPQLERVQAGVDAAKNLLDSDGKVRRRPVLAAFGMAAGTLALGALLAENDAQAAPEPGNPNFLRPIPKEAKEIFPGSGFYTMGATLSPEMGQAIVLDRLAHPSSKDSNRLGGFYGSIWKDKSANGDKSQGVEWAMFERAVILMNYDVNPNGAVHILTYAELSRQKLQLTDKEFIDLPPHAKKILETMALIGSGGTTLKQIRNLITVDSDNFSPVKAAVDTYIDINGNIQQGKTDGVPDMLNMGQENRHNLAKKTIELRDQYGEEWIRDLGLVISDGMYIRTKLGNPKTGQLEETWAFIQLCERGGVVSIQKADGSWTTDTDLAGRMFAAAMLNTFEPQVFPLTLNPDTKPSPKPSPEPSQNPEKHLEVPRTSFRKTAEQIVNGKLLNPGGWPDSLLGQSGIKSVVDPEFANMRFMDTRIKSINRAAKRAELYIAGGTKTVTVNIPDAVADPNNRFSRAEKTTYNTPITWEDAHYYGANPYLDIEGEDLTNNIKGDVAMVFFTLEEYAKLETNTANLAGFNIYV